MLEPKIQLIEPGKLIESVNNNDLIGIYGILTLIAHKDRSFSTNEFMDTMEYVKKHNIPDFIKKFDERKFEQKENWTEAYWEIVLASLLDNFSEKRINHLKEISAHLYPKTNVSGNSAPKNNAENKTATTSSSSNNQGSDIKKNPTLAATAGAAVMCVAALAIESKKIAAMAWMGAVALGGYAVYKLMKKD